MLLWILVIESVGMMAALLMMLIGSELLDEIRLRICSYKKANCLAREEELTESQSGLWYDLTLIGSGVDLMLVEKWNTMAEWSEERSLFTVRFWMLL